MPRLIGAMTPPARKAKRGRINQGSVGSGPINVRFTPKSGHGATPSAEIQTWPPPIGRKQLTQTELFRVRGVLQFCILSTAQRNRLAKIPLPYRAAIETNDHTVR